MESLNQPCQNCHKPMNGGVYKAPHICPHCLYEHEGGKSRFRRKRHQTQRVEASPPVPARADLPEVAELVDEAEFVEESAALADPTPVESTEPQTPVAQSEPEWAAETQTWAPEEQQTTYDPEPQMSAAAAPEDWSAPEDDVERVLEPVAETAPPVETPAERPVESAILPDAQIEPEPQQPSPSQSQSPAVAHQTASPSNTSSEQQPLNAETAKAAASVMLSTKPASEHDVLALIEDISAESALDIQLTADMVSKGKFIGSKSETVKAAVAKAQKRALTQLRLLAHDQGANIITGVAIKNAVKAADRNTIRIVARATGMAAIVEVEQEPEICEFY